ncbi:putative RNA-directed DNA polymerase from transposon BS [Trichonephila clavipes]|nr:putative RNA-directed DNA polymerase from transposon BS [Trichonephila clavipes]
MIDDLEAAIQKVPRVSCLFFADDVVLWATSSNIRLLEDALNSSLFNLVTWANTNKMEVSVEKTVFQLFSLPTKQFLFHLEYKGLPLEQVFLSKYLGINLDNKLHWGTHIAETSEKGLKLINLKKRLTAIKLGDTQDVLSRVYKTYVRSVLDYGCEVVTLASTMNLEKYDVVRNSAFRIITGGAKSTPMTAMQLQTGIEPLDSRRDKFTLKFWERARRVNCRYWNEYRCATQRLKTRGVATAVSMI